jgi:predicted nucleic acid-binding protein
MQLVVADTSPLFYLFTIGHLELLPQLFGRVLIPDAVHMELSHPHAPAPLRQWARSYPGWVEIRMVDPGAEAICFPSGPGPLGAGELAAITLAVGLSADLILIDERKGTMAAVERGLESTGTLGILRRASQLRMIDLEDAFLRLKRTSFRYRQEILDRLLDEARTQRNPGTR